MIQRDYNNTKHDLWDKMIGNIPELNDPANANGNINNDSINRPKSTSTSIFFLKTL